uniref:transposase family protein n=1 Tax=Desulfogranum japonicum TaxID=231447 RepID=UPI00048AE86C
DDPRDTDQIKHNLLDILVIAICGTICGADGWKPIQEYGLAKQEWLSTFLDLPYGYFCPSPDMVKFAISQIQSWLISSNQMFS